MKRIINALLIIATAVYFTIACCPYLVSADVYTEDLKVYVGATKTVPLWLDGTTKWASANKKIATVSSKGKVTGVKSGTTTIVAKNGDDRYIYNVSVYVKRTEAEVKKIINDNLKGTPTNISKKAFSANPKTLVSQLKDLRVGDYIYIGSSKNLIVNRTKYRVTVYDGVDKEVYSYNRLRAMGNEIKVYTRY